MGLTRTIQCPHGHPVEVDDREQHIGDGRFGIVQKTTGSVLLFCDRCGPFVEHADGTVEPISGAQ